jgi:transposase
MTPGQQKYGLLCRLRGGLTVAEAAKAVGVSVSTAYAWRKADADFADQWADAVLDAPPKAGRPALPDGNRAVQVPMRIRAELVPKLQSLGRSWLERAVEQAPDL